MYKMTFKMKMSLICIKVNWQAESFFIWFPTCTKPRFVTEAKGKSEDLVVT